MTRRRWLVLALTLAACGGGGGSSGDAAPGGDGASGGDGGAGTDGAGPSADATPQPTAHHGAWIHLDRDDQVDARYVFGADGAYLYEEPLLPLRIDGTYVIEGTTFVATGTAGDGSRSRRHMAYHANPTALLTEALHPDGAHAGVAGTWTGAFRDDFLDGGGAVVSTSGAAATYVFDDDGTVAWTRTPTPGDAVSLSGTWTLSEPQVSVLYEDPEVSGVTFRTRFTYLDDAALGGRAFAREP